MSKHKTKEEIARELGLAEQDPAAQLIVGIIGGVAPEVQSEMIESSAKILSISQILERSLGQILKTEGGREALLDAIKNRKG